MNRKTLPLIRLTVLLTLLIVGCKPTQTPSTASLDSTPRLVIMSAFEPEMEKLRAEAEITDTLVINGRSHHVGQLGGNDVVILLSGVSMVNAAMTTQAVIDHFDVEAIIFSGIAGGVNPSLNIGDVVVPAQWGQYQEQLFARETAQGWDTGWSSAEFGNFGMMFPQNVSITRKDGATDTEQDRFWFQTDPAMLDVAHRVANDVHLDKCAAQNDCLAGDPKVVVGGNGVSGPTFVDNAEYRNWVWETFQADALDMETAAVAHVAYVNGVPFIAFRSLSDLAGGGPGENEISTFFQVAADNSATTVIAYLEEWSEQ